MKTATKTLWACPACGCTDVQVQVWHHANTDERYEEVEFNDPYWCPQCEEPRGCLISTSSEIPHNHERDLGDINDPDQWEECDSCKETHLAAFRRDGGVCAADL